MRPDPTSPPRLDLVAHLREQILRDPEAYANTAKVREVADRIAHELRCAPREVVPE